MRALRGFVPCCLLLALFSAAAAAGDDVKDAGSPIGIFRLDLTDETNVTGMVLKVTDQFVLIRLKDGDRKFSRTQIKKMEPVNQNAKLSAAPPEKAAPPAAPAPPTQALAPQPDGELAIARRANDVIDDLDEDAVKAERARPRLKGDDNKIMAGLRNGGGAPLEAPRNEPAVRNEAPLAERKEPPPPPRRTTAFKTNPDLPKLFDSALLKIENQSYGLASKDLRILVTSGSKEDIARAEDYSRQTFHRSLGELMVLCYLNDLCKPCQGEGLAQCKLCSGAGYTVKWVNHQPGNAVTPGTRRGGGSIGVQDNASVHRRVSLCEFCRGHGFEPCKQCGGTRIETPDPTTYEREIFSAQMVKLAEETTYRSEGSYGDTYREQPPTQIPRIEQKMRPMTEQIWLRDSANKVKSDIMRLTRAEAYYQLAMKADPLLVLRPGKYLQQELTRLKVRKHNLHGELAERFSVYATNRVERLLDEMQYSDTFGGPGKPERSRFGEVLMEE
ncbi:MAG TPA: zinc finger-like domain-containing protein [Planctomycetota bacterium]|nr:zinc finger-like domain-containing protein [Planctomycetota bacterium]